MRALVLMVLVAPSCKQDEAEKAVKHFEQSKLELASMQVRELALEAYPVWARMHVETNCPGSLDELKEFTNHQELVDPWKHPFRMLCGADLPPGAHGLAVYSLGPDGQDGTADDVKSWVQ
jgi:hypothetical protein